MGMTSDFSPRNPRVNRIKSGPNGPHIWAFVESEGTKS